jgi:hypothetical protein
VLRTAEVQINQGRRRVMKKLLTIVALAATVISAPAFANTPAKFFADSPAAYQRSSDLVTVGHRVGQDPSASVRSMIQRDPHSGS